MQGQEFYDYLSLFPNFKNHFKGIFSIDTLPKIIGYRKFIISNTDIQSGEGKHWFCFFQSSKKEIEIFDSLGIDEFKKSLLTKYCSFRLKELIFNTTAFQDLNSSSCGKFVLYFSIERMFNLDLTFEEFLQLIFDENVQKNETLVEEFCEEIKNK